MKQQGAQFEKTRPALRVQTLLNGLLFADEDLSDAQAKPRITTVAKSLGHIT